MEKVKYANFKFDSIEEVYRWYLEFTKPVHKLRKQEIDVLSNLMYVNYIETGNFKREKDKWNRVFSKEVKAQIREKLNINVSVFNNILSSLRKKNVIIKDNGYNEINKAYLPVINDNNGILGVKIIINLLSNSK